MQKEKTLFIISLLIFTVFLLSIPLPLSAKVTGICSNCHTMHNSQNGTDVNTTVSAELSLLKADCLGCHTGSSSTGFDASTDAPLVLNTDTTTELAGGNFTYITTADNRGHNIVDLGTPDAVLDDPPGNVPSHLGSVSDADLTCAGRNGCHGRRDTGVAKSNLASMQGDHHNDDDDGVIDTATTSANSYRFLWGVKGYENNGQVSSSTKYQNADATNHNEYFGTSTPLAISCSANQCHGGSPAGVVQSRSNTISFFCATCHGNFHTLDVNVQWSDPTMVGIGADNTNPFLRHPTDVLLPATGEYASYNPASIGAYSTAAPVGRTSQPTSMSGTVSVGTGVVMCISCHKSHASNYADMLRWDYSTMDVGTTGAAEGTACFICHTQKDGT